MTQIRTNILLPERLYRDFKARCEASGLGMATVVRRIIEREMVEPSELFGPAGPEDDARRNPGMCERDRAIVAAYEAGGRATDIAKAHNLTPTRILQIVARAK